MPGAEAVADSGAQSDPHRGDGVPHERSVQPMPKLGAWRKQLDDLLAANEVKPARERLTAVRIFETLRDLGFDGGYDAVRRYAKSWRKAREAAAAQAYIPPTFAPGEANQFDWSHETVLMNDVTMVVKSPYAAVP